MKETTDKVYKMIEVNLRRAHLIQQDLKNLITDLEFQVTQDLKLNLSVFEKNIEDVQQRKREELLSLVDRINSLYSVLYDIRSLISKRNHSSGVDKLLAEICILDKRIDLYQELSTSAPAMDVSSIVDNMNYIKEHQSFGLSVSSGSLNENDINKYGKKFKELKIQKRELQDKLLSLNVNSLIVIDDALLKQEGII